MNRFLRAALPGVLLLILASAAFAGGPGHNVTLTGTVTVAATGAPVAGARVYAVHMESREVFTSAPTGADGEYTLSGLPYGYLELAVEAPGGVYLGNRVVTGPAGERVVLSLVLDQPQPEDREWWSAAADRPVPGLERSADGVARIVEGRPAPGRPYRPAVTPEGPKPAVGIGSVEPPFERSYTLRVAGGRAEFDAPAVRGGSLDSGMTLSLGLAHRYNELLSLEAAIQYSRSGADGLAPTRLEVVPVTLTAMFHPLRVGRYDVSVGPALAYVRYSFDGPARLRFEDEFTWGVRARLEAWVGGRWTVSTTVDYLGAKTRPDGPAAVMLEDQRIRPLTVQLGVGRRF